MKKIIYFSATLLIVFLAGSGFSQSSSFSVTPSVQCYNSNGTTAYAGIQAHIPSATSYSWMITSPSTSCTPSYSTVATASGAPTNSLIQINFNCCGIYTISCFGYNTLVSPPALISTIVQTMTLTCPSSTISVTGNTSICSGYNTVLHASGATSYTWQPGNLTGDSIFVMPTVSTCYTVSGTASASCVSPKVVCVNVQSSGSIGINGPSSICAGSSATLYAAGANNYTWLPGGSTATSIVISPTASACYTLSGYTCSGLSSAVKCVSVQTSGTVSVSGPSSICAGTYANLYASGASNYTWLPGGSTATSIAVSPTTSTCYTLLGSGCSGVTSTVKCLTVNSSPVLSIVGNTSVCSGQSTTLTVAGAASYTWYPGYSTSSSIAFTPTATTCYSVAGSFSNGCTGYAGICVYVNSTGSMSVSGPSSLCGGSSATLIASGSSTYTWQPGNLTGSVVVVTPSASTCYTVNGSSGSGCSASSVKCVSVQSTGSVNISGSTYLCAGSSGYLQASGGTSYTWYPGGSNASALAISPTVSTCYTLVGQTCGGSASSYFCVSVNPSPTLSFSGNTTVCAGSSASLSVSGAMSYTWLSSSAGVFYGSSIAFTPSTTTCFTVYGSNSYSYSPSCNAVAFICVSVQAGSLSVSGPNNVCAGSSATLSASGASSYVWYPGNISGSSIVVTPTSSGCYTVYGSNISGCGGSAYAVKCLSVQTGPSLTISGTSTVCAGNTATVFANGANSYTWLPGNITGAVVAISPSVSTCYTIVGTASNGCVGLGSLCMQVMPKPTITTSGGVYCAGSTSTLSASGASSYVWQPGNITGANIVITPSVTTCYTVTGTNSYGCANTAVSCLSVIASPVLTVGGPNVLCAGQSTSLTVSGASSYTWLPGNSAGSGIVISPSVSTCYTVRGYNSANGCISQAIKCVSVQPNPVINISGNSVLCSGNSANLLVSGASSYTWSTGSNAPFITVSPTVNSCYIVYGTNSQGCIGSASKCLTIQAAPSLTISGPGSICYGSSATLYASGASSYNWNTGSSNSVIVVSPTNGTVYTVTGSNGVCTSVKSITVSVNPRPTIYVYTGDSTLCAGNTTTLTAVGANTYTWNNGSVTANIVVSPSVTTNYTVSGTNTNGCSNSALVTVHVSACTGITKQENHLGIKFYPNPISDVLHIQNEGSNTISYIIYDVLGREILSGEFTSSKTIDFSSYANGTYIIRFESDALTTYKKIVVEK